MKSLASTSAVIEGLQTAARQKQWARAATWLGAVDYLQLRDEIRDVVIEGLRSTVHEQQWHEVDSFLEAAAYLELRDEVRDAAIGKMWLGPAEVPARTLGRAINCATRSGLAGEMLPVLEGVLRAPKDGARLHEAFSGMLKIPLIGLHSLETSGDHDKDSEEARKWMVERFEALVGYLK